MSTDLDTLDWLDLDRESLRNTGRLRLVAALVTAGAALWLRIQVPQTWVWVVLGVAALACLFWVRSFVRLDSSVQDESIAADPHGFFQRSAEETTFVPWTTIEDIVLDQELGAVRLERADAPAITLQNRYGKMGLEDLHAWFEQRRSQWHKVGEHHGEI